MRHAARSFLSEAAQEKAPRTCAQGLCKSPASRPTTPGDDHDGVAPPTPARGLGDRCYTYSTIHTLLHTLYAILPSRCTMVFIHRTLCASPQDVRLFTSIYLYIDLVSESRVKFRMEQEFRESCSSYPGGGATGGEFGGKLMLSTPRLAKRTNQTNAAPRPPEITSATVRFRPTWSRQRRQLTESASASLFARTKERRPASMLAERAWILASP